MTVETFGKLCKQYREKRGISKAELGRRLNVSRFAVGNWENDTNKPSGDTLLKLADELQLSPEEKIQFFQRSGKEELVRLAKLDSQSSLPTQNLSQDISLTQHIIVPLQRPPRIPYFTGREIEIGKIIEELKPGRVITLVGPGGIGKTAIATEVVWRLAPGNEPPLHFSDGIIFHNFYNQPQVDLAFEHIVASFDAKQGQETARDAAQRVLAKRHILLLLDGAENADDLEKLLEICGECGILITTRHRHDTEGAMYIIETLSSDQARTVLQAWSKGQILEQEIADQICDLVGFLPLALRIGGSYMVQRERNAFEYLEILKETPLPALHLEERQHKSVPILLEKSLTELDVSTREVLGIVGLLALAPFGQDVIADALESSSGKVGQILGELINYSLLERTRKSYQVTHALVHTYASERVTSPDTALPRLAAYYTRLAEEQNKRGVEGYAKLDVERAHIMAILARCLNQKDWESVQSLAWVIDDYLNLQGYWLDRITTLQAALAAAKSLQDQRAVGRSLSKLGATYRELGQVETTLGYLQQALAIAQERGYRSDEGKYLGGLGTARAVVGQNQQAIEYYEQALIIAREISDQRSEGIWLGNLGLTHLNMGQLEPAIPYLQQALVISREIGNRFDELAWVGNLGTAYAALSQYQTAMDHVKQALAIARELGARSSEAIWLDNLGNAYAALGQYQQAIEYHQQALVIPREIGARDREGVSLTNLGEVYATLGEVEIAIDYLQQALVILEEIKSPTAKETQHLLDEVSKRK